jgi:hypothetical protein
MNIYDFALYVNQDVDDTFTNEEIARFFNKGIANFNLIPPVTKFPFINMNLASSSSTDAVNEFDTNLNNTSYKVNVAENTYNATANPPTFTHNDDYDEEIGAFAQYPLSNNFMLGVMLPFVVSAVKGQESSITEKQLVMQEFMLNARQFKSSLNIKTGYLVDGEGNAELSQYKLGENVYLSDMTQSPMAGPWNKASVYKEYVVTKKNDGTIVKYVDDSLVDEDVETMTEEEKY